MAEIVNRIGNNITVNITVTDGSGSSNIIGILGYSPKYEIQIIKKFGRTYNVPTEIISADLNSGKFSFVWKAGKQYGVGDYTILLRLYDVSTDMQGNDVKTDNFNSIDFTDAIKLTSHTCQGTSKDSVVSIKFEI